jgi:hypothetical protein
MPTCNAIRDATRSGFMNNPHIATFSAEDRVGMRFATRDLRQIKVSALTGQFSALKSGR